MTERHASQTVFGDSPAELEAAALAAARAELGDVPLEVVPGYVINEVGPPFEQAAAGRRYVAGPAVREVPAPGG